MTWELRMCSVVALLLLSSCTSIPDAVLEQERQREPLRAECATAIGTFYQATDPAWVNLNVCKQHQVLAHKIIDYIGSLPKEREVTWEEVDVFKRAFNHLVSVYIDLCYAKVRLGEEIKNQQGRTGIAVCDRLVEEKRHRETLEAIERAREQIQSDIFIYRQRDY